MNPRSSRPGKAKRQRGFTIRTRLIAFFSVLVLFGILGRLVWIQGLDASQIASRALAGRLVTQPLPADRGVILGADGTVLADNADRYQIVVDQVNVTAYKDEDDNPLGAWGAAKAMAPILGTEAGLIFPKLSGDKRWNPVATGITSEVWREVQDLEIPGITAEKYTVRSYPSGAVAGNLIGWVGSDGVPLAGLELQHQKQLQGKDGSRQFEKGLKGDIIPLGENDTTPPVNGTGLELTIDPQIQMFAQRSIAAAVKKHNAQWGTVVIEEIGTGRLLAVAQAPTVDPNNPGGVGGPDRGARAFTDPVEPGSTGKAITAAALIEEGLVTPESQFTVPDRWKAPNGEEFRDSSNHEDEKLTFSGIIEKSSNTGTLMAGEKLSLQQRYDYLKKFGLGESSGIDFPGAAKGIVRPYDKWDGRTAYTVMFGQGLSATTLQSASVFATLGNGGVRVPQQLVKGTVSDSGRVSEIPPKEGTRVVSEETADSVGTMLEAVVARGTGTSAQVKGYRAAGKTGTAQIAAGKDRESGYTANFSGFAPAESPKVAVSVTLQRPTKGYYGGTSAAPVFSEVTGYALRQMGVAPSTEEPKLIPKEWK